MKDRNRNEKFAPLELKYYVNPAPALNSMCVEQSPYIAMNRQAAEHERLKMIYLAEHPEAAFERGLDAHIEEERTRHIRTVSQDRARKSVWEYARDRSNGVLAENPYIVKKPLLIAIILFMAVIILTLVIPSFFDGDSDVREIFSPFRVNYMKDYTVPEASEENPVTEFTLKDKTYSIGGKTVDADGKSAYAVVFVDEKGNALGAKDSLLNDCGSSVSVDKRYARYSVRRDGYGYYDRVFVVDTSADKIYTPAVYYPSFIEILKSWLTRPSEKEGYTSANKESFLYRMAVLDNKELADSIAAAKADKRVLAAFVSKAAYRGVAVFFILFAATAVAIIIKAAIGLASSKKRGWTLTFFWAIIVSGLFVAELLLLGGVGNVGAGVGQLAYWSTGLPVCAIVSGSAMLVAVVIMPFIYRLLKLKEALPYVFDTLIDSKIVSD